MYCHSKCVQTNTFSFSCDNLAFQRPMMDWHGLWQFWPVQCDHWLKTWKLEGNVVSVTKQKITEGRSWIPILFPFWSHINGFLTDWSATMLGKGICYSGMSSKWWIEVTWHWIYTTSIGNWCYFTSSYIFVHNHIKLDYLYQCLHVSSI